MANVRINQFQNIPLFHQAFGSAYTINGDLRIQGVYLPGSLSFNNVAMVLTASGTTAKTLTLSFGLYSLNGSTLSLANSASFSTNPTANATSWITLSTSATQDITPGNWYFAYIQSTSSNSRVGFFGNVVPAANTGGRYGGIFVRGGYSATTSAFPASIATSDMTKEPVNTANDGTFFPNILISA